MITKTRSRFNHQAYNFAFLDEGSKREIRRKTLKAVAIPGYQVPFASRDLPIGSGWGTGGLQLTYSLLGPDDRLKVIDQGNDDSVNAVSIRKLAEMTTGIETTTETERATLIQSRHRIPEAPLQSRQILVMQVPSPDPLSRLVRNEPIRRRMHAERDYSIMWLSLYENFVKWGKITIGATYPVMVEERYLMTPTPIPRWDIAKLNGAEHLTLFGAGREKKIYAIPPHTKVEPLEFTDIPFEKEHFNGHTCAKCGSANSYLDEITDAFGVIKYQCSDTAYCSKRSMEQRTRGQ